MGGAQSQEQVRRIHASRGSSRAPFNDWIGDSTPWAEAMWTTYNGLKHRIDYGSNARDLADLAATARLLLTADILKKVAGTKEPSRAIFGSDYRTWPLQSRLQKGLLADDR